MVRSLVAKNISLYDLAQEFKLRSTPEPLMIDRLPALTDPEQQALERLRSNYLNLTRHRPLSEVVKMVVLSPLLDLAGFYQPPFDIETEKPIKISAEDEGTFKPESANIWIITKW
jgi:hypothetical protein